MAYSDYGAFVWKNGEIQNDCCDTDIEIGDLYIEGHAIIDLENLIFEFYKTNFPVIYEKLEDGTYKQWGEDEFIRHYGINKLYPEVRLYLPEGQLEPTLNDFYYSFGELSSFEYKGYEFYFCRNRFENNIWVNIFTISTPENDNWYCVYGSSFGNGFNNNLSKCHNKHLYYDEDKKIYQYDCENIDRKMLRAYTRDQNHHEIHWIKESIKGIFKDILQLKFNNLTYDFGELICNLKNIKIVI